MKSSGAFKPFQHLRHLIQSKSIEVRSSLLEHSRHADDESSDSLDEEQLFAEAMADVTPITADKRIEKTAAAAGDHFVQASLDSEPIRRLQRLLENGEGFDVASTSEYQEGVGYQTHPAVSRYLHSGIFSIESHIDLHGFNVSMAKERFDDFMDAAVKSGKRAVLVIHGRGLASPQMPVHISMVHQWLTTGLWRKWVIAFGSARPCVGGAGATYVLMRSRPLTKRLKKHGPRQC